MNRQSGMTLIELLVTLAIVAILSSLAISSYRSYTLRANRIEAETVLMKVQVAEEKFFLQNNTYTTTLATAPPAGLGIAATTPSGYYTLAIAAGTTGSITTSYAVTATATGAQTHDKTACLTLAINDQGQQTPAPSSDCWK
ncbi:MAG: type IV pilin protein [Proteobacteria bacterium]|nr:type IV pilin protein [Pseudomonadota bacterium]